MRKKAYFIVAAFVIVAIAGYMLFASSSPFKVISLPLPLTSRETSNMIMSADKPFPIAGFHCRITSVQKIMEIAQSDQLPPVYPQGAFVVIGIEAEPIKGQPHPVLPRPTLIINSKTIDEDPLGAYVFTATGVDQFWTVRFDEESKRSGAAVFDVPAAAHYARLRLSTPETSRTIEVRF